MKMVDGTIQYTAEEIEYLNKANPILFDLAVMVNEEMGEDIFYTRNCAKPLRRGMTLIEAQRVDVLNPGVCAVKVLFGGYLALRGLCGGVMCTIRPNKPSCFEYTWKEATGQMPRIKRWDMTFEERKKLLMKGKSIKVV